jgi:hypothetical protein
MKNVFWHRCRGARGFLHGEEIKIPIPFKLLEMHEALENNFDWIVS